MYPFLVCLSTDLPPVRLVYPPRRLYLKLDKQQPNQTEGTESHIVCPSNGFSSPISRAADEKEAID